MGTEEITEEEIPDSSSHVIEIQDMKDTIVEADVKPVIVEIKDDITTVEQLYVEPKVTEDETTTTESMQEKEIDDKEVQLKKKTIKKKKVIKRKTVINEEGSPTTTEEVFEEEVPISETISIQDEQETSVEDIVRPVKTDAKDDRIAEAEFFISGEKTENEKIITEVYEDVKIEDAKGKKVRTSIKKKKTTKQREIVDDEGNPVITEEITEEEIPDSSSHVIEIQDMTDTIVETDVKPVIVEIKDDITTVEQLYVEPNISEEETTTTESMQEKEIDDKEDQLKKKTI